MSEPVSIPDPTATKPPGLVKEHAKAYAATYLIAGIFVVVTILQSFVAQFAKYQDFTSEQLAHVTRIQWAFAGANTLISAGIVILAFLNQTLARANAKREGKTNAPFPP